MLPSGHDSGHDGDDHRTDTSRLDPCWKRQVSFGLGQGKADGNSSERQSMGNGVFESRVKRE